MIILHGIETSRTACLAWPGRRANRRSPSNYLDTRRVKAGIGREVATAPDPDIVREKGGSRPVSRILYPGSKPRAVVIHLGPPLPTASSGLPEPQALRATASAPIWPCSGRGLPSRPCHQDRWWALTPPFHPCPCPTGGRWAVSLSVALSVGSPRLGVTQLPALWSPDFPRAVSRPRPPGRLSHQIL